MDNILSLDFMYRSKTHFALIRTNLSEGKKRHSITVMNGDLERILFGHHVIIEKDGILQEDEYKMTEEVAELKHSIVRAFRRHLELQLVS